MHPCSVPDGKSRIEVGWTVAPHTAEDGSAPTSSNSSRGQKSWMAVAWPVAPHPREMGQGVRGGDVGRGPSPRPSLRKKKGTIIGFLVGTGRRLPSQTPIRELSRGSPSDGVSDPTQWRWTSGSEVGRPRVSAGPTLLQGERWGVPRPRPNMTATVRASPRSHSPGGEKLATAVASALRPLPGPVDRTTST
jgi:hypothetical protein